MGLYSSPEAPPPPDYAEANRAGIEADAATLPMRLAVNAAAQTGQKWTDPQTGRTYDFTGLGLIDADVAAAEQLMRAGSELALEEERRRYDQLRGEFDADYYLRENPDIAQFIENGGYGQGSREEQAKRHYEEYGQQEGRNAKYTGGMLEDFNRLNLEQQEAALDLALRKSGDFTRNQLEQELEYRGKFGDSQRTEDEKTWQQNLRLGQEGTRSMTDLQEELLPRLIAMQRASADAAFRDNLDQADMAGTRAAALQERLLPGLNDLQLRMQGDAVDAANEAGRRNNAGTFAVRDQLAQQILEELQSGEGLTDAQRERAEQEVRRSQASRGNILGDAAAFDEAISKSRLAEEIAQTRKANALGLINSRDLAPQFASMGVVNPTQVVAPNNQPVQPVNPLMPNYQSSGPINPMVPNLQPTTTSGPNLQSSTINRNNPLALFDPNAAQNSAQMATNVWNTQYQQTMSQSNPWMEGLGMVAGIGLGAFTGGLGTAAAGALMGGMGKKG